MSKKTTFTKVNPATLFNITCVPTPPPKDARPPRPPHHPHSAHSHRSTQPPRPALAEWEYAVCPKCKRRFEILPGCILRKLGEEDSEESEERGFGFGTFMLNPDTECFECDYSNRVSGWCCIVDTFCDEEYAEIRKMELKKYYTALEKGEDVQTELRLVWSPNPEEVEHRAANYEIRKKMLRMRRADEAMRRAFRRDRTSEASGE